MLAGQCDRAGVTGQRSRITVLGRLRVALGGRFAIATCQSNFGNYGESGRIVGFRVLFRCGSSGTADEEPAAGNQQWQWIR